LIVIATATSPTSWRVESVVFGAGMTGDWIEDPKAMVEVSSEIQTGEQDLVAVVDLPADGTISPAQTHYMVQRLDDAGAHLDFLSHRHFVDRAAVVKELDAWIAGDRPTPRFRWWIAGADLPGAAPPRSPAITMIAIVQLEWFSALVEDLERLDREQAERLRSRAAPLLEVLRKFPPYESEAELEAATNGAEQPLSWYDLDTELDRAVAILDDERQVAAKLLWAEKQRRHRD
jgi:hypothetical protein